MNELATSFVETARGLLPEFLLIGFASGLALWGTCVSIATSAGRKSLQVQSVWLGAIALLAALAAIVFWPGAAVEDLARVPFLFDSFANTLRIATLAVGLLLLVFVREQLHARYAAEQISCLLLIVAGSCLVASANDLVAMFIALELVSIPTYVMLYLSRHDRQSLEATIKYFLLSIFSSAFVLYGMSLLLGSAGSTNFAWIRQSLVEPTGMVNVAMLQIAIAMTVAGLGFRITAVPFHFYAPDVFQGTSTAMASLLAVLPKFVGFAALVRMIWATLLTPGVNEAFAGLSAPATGALAILAIVTMTAGNVLALQQTELRRLLAYSSVAHAGYMLVGLAVLPGASQPLSGAQAVLFYLLVYALMTLGVFGAVLLVRKNGKFIENISDLDGLGVSSPIVAMIFAVFLFSLTGLPPTAGFWGKFNLFLAAWSTGELPLRLLAVGLAVNAAIAGWYYLRLVRRIYLNPAPANAPSEASRSLLLATTVGLCAVALLVLFFHPNPLWKLVADAATGTVTG